MAKDLSGNLAPHLASSDAQEIEIDSRFGKIMVRQTNPIIFDKGMLGFPDRRRFNLVEFPVKKFPHFKLLQCLDDHQLAFITLPIDIDNSIIERKDIEEGCKDLGIPVEHLALLLVVTVHRDINAVRLSANARAPLFLHAETREAEQYVLRNSKYEVRHALSDDFFPKKN
ncbi:MAG: flagellar assembly protein FliW [Rickettsiales bacterium]